MINKYRKPRAAKVEPVEMPPVTRRMAKFDGPDPVDIHVGSRLRLQRTILGLSQTDLAERVGLTFQAIQKYERGDIRISASRLYELAKVLGIPVASFFDGLPDSATAGTEDTVVPHDEDEEVGGRASLELVRTFSAVKDPELRRVVVQLLRRAASLPASEGHEAEEDMMEEEEEEEILPPPPPPPPPVKATPPGPGRRRAR
jgi:transcriptional regulator with XRE-family HTH domain